MVTSCTVVSFTRAFTLIAMNTTLILMCREPDRKRLAIVCTIVDCIENDAHGGLWLDAHDV